MKTIGRIIIGLGLFALLVTLPAQAALESTPTNTLVAAVAAEAGLPVISVDEISPLATFFVVADDSGGNVMPYPCPPPGLEGDTIYALTPTAVLVDATIQPTTSLSPDDLTNQASTLLMFVDQELATVQNPRRAMGAMAMDSIDPTDPGEGDTNDYGGYTNSFVPFPLDTNTLWIEISNVDNIAGIAYANLHKAEGTVYAIEVATSLTGNWQVENEVWPTDTNCQPFTMQTLGRNLLFLKAEDWTGVDSDSDGVPDWWAWVYWGTNDVPDANLDYSGNGNTFAQDYSNNITPAVFSFTGIEVANNVVSSTTTPMQLDVAGHPYYMAAVLDDTNYVADANWQLYPGSSVTVSLGLTEGWHDVWIGLLGHGSDPTNAVWQWQRMKLDYTAPALVITGPTNDTVAVPLVQITGYSPEALASINYDLSNAVETVTNQPTMITGEAYSTNTFEFTTNYFQCYDVPLASGLNAITLHATDLAGNVTTLATNITCSATTNPPVVSLIWPQNGMQISSDSITLQGRVDDPMASVVVSSVDAAGNTNRFSGLTGRDGVFWVENVPLGSGTNQLAITVSNAVGETTTNATLVQSAVGLTVNSVQAGDTLVTGTMGASGYTVWVNGNQATNNGDGTWTAQITPLCVGGGQVQVTAIPNSDNGGNGSGGGDGTNPSSSQSLNTQATVQPPQGTFISSYHKNYQNPYPFDAGAFWMIGGGGGWDYDTLNWEDGGSGTDEVYYDLGYELPFPVNDSYSWPANNWPQPLPDGTKVHLYWDYDQYNETTTVVTNQSEIGGPALAQEHCDMTGNALYSNEPVRRTADTAMKLATGGPLGSKQMNLWCLTANATAYTNLNDTTGTSVPYDQIEIGSYGNLDTNGELWVMLPDNDPDITTPETDRKNYTFSEGATRFHPYIAVNGVNLDYNTPTNCVGQQVTFSVGWFPYTPDRIADVAAIWTLPGVFVNTNSDPNCDLYYSEDTSQLSRVQSRDGTTSNSCWYVDGLKEGTVKLTMNVQLQNGKQYVLQTSGQFNVFRPSTTFTKYQDGTPTVMVTNGVLSLGWNRDRDMSFGHTISLVNVPNNLSGQAGYVQLVSGSYTEPILGNTIDIGGGTPDTELDTVVFPRGQPSTPANTNSTVVFWDGPYDALHQGNAKEDLGFSNYLMFKPSGGIWVPLRLIEWELHDEAANGAVVSGTASITSDSDCTIFPDWKNTWAP